MPTTTPLSRPLAARPSSAGRSLIAGLLLGVTLMTPAAAQKPKDLGIGEISLLPPYCIDTMGLRPGALSGSMGPNAPHWFSVLGPSFQTMHHYCWALIGVRRAGAAGMPAIQRDALLRQAINDMMYVVNFAAPNFVLLPEILVKIGDTHVMLKRYQSAIAAYYAARERKPDYWLIYSRWASVLGVVGDRKGAMAMLEEGIRAVPTAPELRSQYKQLGGDPEKIVPSDRVQRPAEPPAAPASAPQAAEPASSPAASGPGN